MIDYRPILSFKNYPYGAKERFVLLHPVRLDSFFVVELPVSVRVYVQPVPQPVFRRLIQCDRQSATLDHGSCPLCEELLLALELGQFDVLWPLRCDFRHRSWRVARDLFGLSLTMVLQPLFVLCPPRRRQDNQTNPCSEQNIDSLFHFAVPPITVNYPVGLQVQFALATDSKTLIPPKTLQSSRILVNILGIIKETRNLFRRHNRSSRKHLARFRNN